MQMTLKRKYRVGKSYKAQKSALRTNPSRAKRSVQLDKAQISLKTALDKRSQEIAAGVALHLGADGKRRWVRA